MPINLEEYSGSVGMKKTGLRWLQIEVWNLYARTPAGKLLENRMACAGVDVPHGQWNTVQAIEPGYVIVEVKDGKYEPRGAEDELEL